MLKTIQIIALLQGVFLLIVLFRNKTQYKKVTFWLFIGSIVSILFYILGDDENSFIHKTTDWFLFDSSLFITFLFLFFRYLKSEKQHFNLRDLLFFVPNGIYMGMEIIELNERATGIAWVEVLEISLQLIFIAYLSHTLFEIFISKRKTWVIYIAIPIVLILGLSSINEVLMLFDFSPVVVSSENDYATYIILAVAFLFYLFSFYLILQPESLLPLKQQQKYKTSSLNKDLIETYKTALINAMEQDKLYTDPKLSIHKVSEKLNIPRQYISEVLNLHLNKSFLDFVNEYRIEAFIEKLQNDQYAHFTLLGIANEVGFNSKSTFNATFKKIKGLTPSEYKNSSTQ